MKEISSIVKLWNKVVTSNLDAALATLVQVYGSHYRKPGARMLFTRDGETAGSISGGCLEKDLREHARKVIQTGTPVVIQYDTTTENDLVLGTGMGCGGLVNILIEPTTSTSCRDFLNNLKSCYDSNQLMAIATVWRVNGDKQIELGQRMTLHSDGACSTDFSDNELTREISDNIKDTLNSRTNRNKIVNLTGGEVELFLESVFPPVSLAVFGAGDDCIPLFEIARQLGWQVTIIDHRKELLTVERFPKASALHVLHANEIAKLKIENFDATVIMTHNYNQDLELLKQLLPAGLRYIGLLGAVKRSEKLFTELRKQGMTIDEHHPDNNIFSPAGLDIGAEGKNEIALSIIAEIQAVLSKRDGQSLREKAKRANQ